MSEPILNAIIKLFALVAKEGLVNKQERDQIQSFLNDHVGQRSVGTHLQQFDDYCKVIANHSPEQEAEDIRMIAAEINQEVDQKQKNVIIIELMSIVMADGMMTAHEERISRTIGSALNVTEADQELIKYYVLGQRKGEFENECILSIDSEANYTGKGKHIYREHLDGLIAILYLASTESFFFKYIGHTDVYLNSVPQRPGNINALAIGSLIRWGTTDPVYYGDILGVFKKIGNVTRTSFEGIGI